MVEEKKAFILPIKTIGTNIEGTFSNGGDNRIIRKTLVVTIVAA